MLGKQRRRQRRNPFGTQKGNWLGEIIENMLDGNMFANVLFCQKKKKKSKWAISTQLLTEQREGHCSTLGKGEKHCWIQVRGQNFSIADSNNCCMKRVVAGSTSFVTDNSIVRHIALGCLRYFMKAIRDLLRVLLDYAEDFSVVHLTLVELKIWNYFSGYFEVRLLNRKYQ